MLWNIDILSIVYVGMKYTKTMYVTGQLLHAESVGLQGRSCASAQARISFGILKFNHKLKRWPVL